MNASKPVMVGTGFHGLTETESQRRSTTLTVCWRTECVTQRRIQDEHVLTAPKTREYIQHVAHPRLRVRTLDAPEVEVEQTFAAPAAQVRHTDDGFEVPRNDT